MEYDELAEQAVQQGGEGKSEGALSRACDDFAYSKMAASNDTTPATSPAALRKPRKRFCIDEDLCLLREVATVNPFENPDAWGDVAGGQRQLADDGFRVQGKQKTKNQQRADASPGGANAKGAAVFTILFRPLARKGSLAGVSRFEIEHELVDIPLIGGYRVNHRLNTAAVDTQSERSREALLAVRTLCGIEVRAQVAQNTRNARGVLRDIDLPGSETEIISLIETPINILRATLRRSSMFVTFEGPQAPDAVYIRGVRVRVQHLDPRPIQCERCGRFNHLTSACRSGPRCGNCGGSHYTPSCTEHTQKCANCGGKHHFSSPKCRLWRRERAIVTRLPHRICRSARRDANISAHAMSTTPKPHSRTPKPPPPRAATARPCRHRAQPPAHPFCLPPPLRPPPANPHRPASPPSKCLGPAPLHGRRRAERGDRDAPTWQQLQQLLTTTTPPRGCPCRTSFNGTAAPCGRGTMTFTCSCSEIKT
ncbi:hypothetical protein HPB48_023291 [Haemaphysalis longicornis]|uniref:Gag-like protein n=1 Tax=Haemaphysalis longicornis TaxID=44386 RepID=A0A9J6GW75_HAELO|nr:hypothetical protein HPB48_023291 [Haemaphysalis longicornis]